MIEYWATAVEVGMIMLIIVMLCRVIYEIRDTTDEIKHQIMMIKDVLREMIKEDKHGTI